MEDLIFLDLKKPSKADLQKGLWAFISISYSREQADSHMPAIGEVHSLRESSRQISLKALSDANADDSVGLLARYARLLTSMGSRFGTAVDEALRRTEAQLAFTWNDALRPEAKCTLSQLGFERACAMFNLAAALSYRATIQNTADADGLRAACQDFQHAAGCLDAAVGSAAGTRWATYKGLTLDVRPAAFEGFRALMLAQAPLPAALFGAEPALCCRVIPFVDKSLS